MDHAIPGGYNSGPRPKRFINIGEGFDVKYDALDCYEVLTKTNIKAVMYRDRYYGLTYGMTAAEGFIQEYGIQ